MHDTMNGMGKEHTLGIGWVGLGMVMEMGKRNEC